MNKWKLSIAAVVAVAFGLYGLSGTAQSDEKQRGFTGAGKCKTCHKKAEQGEQFKIWSESGHAKAYETLASDLAKTVGKKLGIEDPQKADECLRCHVTAHGVADEHLGTKYAITEGVSCESCHGAGGDYYKKKTMTAIAAGEIDGATVGLVTPTKEVCIQCHNDKSPTYTEFDFDKMVAKIAHPKPKVEGAE